MVLLNGARALGQVGKLGQITPGSVADLVAFPHAPKDDHAAFDAPQLDPYRHVVQSRDEPNLLLVNGQKLEDRRKGHIVREPEPAAAVPGS